MSANCLGVDEEVEGLPWSGVVGMRTVCGVSVGSLVLFLDCVVGECLAAGVLAVPDGLRDIVGEADHIVLPE